MVVRILARQLALAIALAAAAPATGAAATTLEYAQLDAVAAQPQAVAKVRALHAAKSTAEVLALCTDLSAPGTTNEPTVHDYLTVRCAIALAAHPQTPTSRAWLLDQSQRPVRVWAAHRHNGRATRVPAFDPAAAARFALTRYAARRATRLAPRTQPALADLRRALPSDASLGARVVTGAVAATDIQALHEVLEHGDAPAQRKALAAAAAWPDVADGLDLLHAAASHSELADQALYALAQVIRRDPAQTGALLRHLDSDDTALAAAGALGSLKRPDIARALAAALDTADSPITAAAHVLAIAQSGDARALALLKRWGAGQGRWPALRAKVRTTYFEDAP